MKHELFALESASVVLNDACVFSDFSMHIHEGEILGVICDNVTEQQSLLSLFSGECRIDGVTRLNSEFPSGTPCVSCSGRPLPSSAARTV